MKNLAECLNPKSGKITQDAHDYLYRVSGGAEVLSWDIHLLIDYLGKTYTINYEGDALLGTMAARVDAISREVVELINMIEEKGLEPE